MLSHTIRRDKTLKSLEPQRRADPSVRVFAERALKEIRLGGSDANMLSDKEAFAEFMDRLSERYVTRYGPCWQR